MACGILWPVSSLLSCGSTLCQDAGVLVGGARWAADAVGAYRVLRAVHNSLSGRLLPACPKMNAKWDGLLGAAPSSLLLQGQQARDTQTSRSRPGAMARPCSPERREGRNRPTHDDCFGCPMSDDLWTQRCWARETDRRPELCDVLKMLCVSHISTILFQPRMLTRTVARNTFWCPDKSPTEHAFLLLYYYFNCNE
jgi:hypothetical protein